MGEKDFKRLLEASAADTERRVDASEFGRRIHAVEEKSRTLEESLHRLQSRMDRLEAMTATQ